VFDIDRLLHEFSQDECSLHGFPTDTSSTRCGAHLSHSDGESDGESDEESDEESDGEASCALLWREKLADVVKVRRA
jgi:hypothetical protein